jgi:hypothetical protein
MRITKSLILAVLFVTAIAMLSSVTVVFKDTTSATWNLLSVEYGLQNSGALYPLGTTTPTQQYKVVYYNAGINGVIDPLSSAGLPTIDDVLITNGPGANPQPVTCAPPGAHGWTQTQGYTIAATGDAVNTFIDNNIYCRIFNSNDLATATKYIVPAAAYTVLASPAAQNPSPITMGGWSAWTLINDAPPADTFQLTVTSSGEAGTIAMGGTALTPGQATPWTSEVLDATTTLVGTYSMTPKDGGTWSAAQEVVAGDFAAAPGKGGRALMTKTINFTWTPHTYTYNLQVNGPAGYTVSQGTYSNEMPHQFVCSTEVNDLIGTWTPSAAGAGFHWVPATHEVVAGDFTLATKNASNLKAIQGSRNNGAKTAYVYNGTITFERVEDEIVVVPVDPTTIPDTYTTPPLSEVAGTYTATGAGVHDLFIPALPGETAAFAFISGAWLPGGAPNWTWLNVDFGDAKGVIPVVTFRDDTTLPVELSYFGATLTAQNFVKLSWISQSETSLLGYRVYRNDSANQASAVSITSVMVPATNTSTTANYSITDNEVAIGSTYYYWLESVDMGTSSFHGPIIVLVEGEVPPVLPNATAMGNAYPNPFRMNTSTTIDVRVKAGDNGTVTIYNILGQSVKTFKVTEGLNPLNWNGKDSKGNVCGSGIYFYKLSTNAMNQTKKMVIVK